MVAARWMCCPHRRCRACWCSGQSWSLAQRRSQPARPRTRAQRGRRPARARFRARSRLLAVGAPRQKVARAARLHKEGWERWAGGGWGRGAAAREGHATVGEDGAVGLGRGGALRMLESIAGTPPCSFIWRSTTFGSSASPSVCVSSAEATLPEEGGAGGSETGSEPGVLCSCESKELVFHPLVIVVAIWCVMSCRSSWARSRETRRLAARR